MPRLLVSALAVLTALSCAAGDSSPAGNKALRAALEPFVARGELAGAVALVSDKDRVLAVEAVGFADVAGKRAMAPDAVFWIASMTKPVTAALVMMLVDEGKVKLDDPVEKYLPEFKDVRAKGGKPATTMTVRHLLSHTSGLPFRSKEEQPTLDALTLQEASLAYAKTPLNGDPGTTYAYSNAGINAAGRIVEVASGETFEAFLQKRLLDPLGMKDTTFRPAGKRLGRVAKAYAPGKDRKGLVETKIAQLRYPLDDKKRQPMPAGGLFSTADDVARFGRMVLNGGTAGTTRLLSEAAVKEMTKQQVPPALKNRYGLGWSVGGDGFGHGGALATDLWVQPGRGRVLVYMVQHAGFPGEGGKANGAFRRAAAEAFPAK